MPKLAIDLENLTQNRGYKHDVKKMPIVPSIFWPAGWSAVFRCFLVSLIFPVGYIKKTSQRSGFHHVFFQKSIGFSKAKFAKLMWVVRFFWVVHQKNLGDGSRVWLGKRSWGQWWDFFLDPQRRFWDLQVPTFVNRQISYRRHDWGRPFWGRPAGEMERWKGFEPKSQLWNVEIHFSQLGKE